MDQRAQETSLISTKKRECGTTDVTHKRSKKPRSLSRKAFQTKEKTTRLWEAVFPLNKEADSATEGEESLVK